MSSILKRFTVGPLSAFVFIIVSFSLFQGCNKNEIVVDSPKKILSDTAIAFGIDSTFIAENLSEDEFGIFLRIEDTTRIPFSDLLLPNGDTLVNYLSKDFLNVYPLSLRQAKSNNRTLRSSGYTPKDEQINAFNLLIAQITAKAEYIKNLRGKPFFPDEGNNKPAQQKIGYASGGMKKYLFKGNIIRKDISGISYKIRSFTPGCTDSIYALNSAGFISTIFDVDGVKKFPVTFSNQSNPDVLKSSLPDILDKNKFEVVDLGTNFPKNGILTGDLISFYYNDNPIPDHIGFSAKGHNDNLQFYHSIGSPLSCSKNESLLGGPVSWNMNKLNESNLTGTKGSIKYHVRRIRYIAELELLPSIIDSTPGATNDIQLKVYSSDNLPIKDNLKVQFNSPDGSVESSALTKDGIVHFKWQLENRSGLQSLVVVVKSPIDNSTILDQLSISINAVGVPIVKSIDTSLIAKTMATINTTIGSNGGFAIIEEGICYSTHPGVSIIDNTVIANKLSDSLAIDIPGLTKSTTYYARSYAKNAIGIGYSDEISFTTLNDADDPYNLSGTWVGLYIESSIVDAVYYRMKMNVTIQGDQFKGIVTEVDLADYPIRTLIGVVNFDGTQLTLIPEGPIEYENPWTITGNKISGAVKTNPPTSPDAIISTLSYQFTKQ